MPYLDADWTRRDSDGQVLETVPAGLWVPETDWEGWKRRGIGLSLRDMWVRDRDITPAELDQLALLSDENREIYLSALGRDLGSAQRDGFFYMNLLEQLKQSPDDDTAGKVIDTMKKLGFASAEWNPDVGGPRHQSPWSVDSVMGWLLKNMAKVGRFILRTADVLIGTLVGALKGGPNISAVAIGAFPPSLGVELSTELFSNRPAWTAIHRFLENASKEIERA